MPRLTLRVRVALAAALAIAIAVTLLGAATLTLVDRQLGRSLDDGLRDRAVEVARLVATTPRLVTAAGVLEGRVGTSAAYVQVVDDQGRIVARSGALGGRVLPQGSALRRALNERVSGYEDVRLGDEPLRVYAAPLGSIGGGAAAGGAVAVAGTTSSIGEIVDPLRRLVLVAALVAAALAGLLAVLLTRRALRPLTRLTDDAEAIARTGDPSRRLGSGAGSDEVGRLTATLNAMLDSLARARARERRFVDDASHELRTPLTALRGNAAYVARHGADGEALADIEADAARLTELLDDLLALAREDAAARPNAITAETVDLAELARTVAADHPAATVTAGGGGALVRGDRAALERALRNLVENAERHGPAGGAIEIAVAGGARTARLAVTDGGAGLTPAEAERAFQRFWRGEGAAPGGSGLGLAIVRATAERHGGSARAEGATFTIELPLSGPLKELSKNGHTTLASPDAKDAT
ncbi:HAMP domain-containing sensor histidine kinase [Conexibacter stalactiti]|uniref:histidine kinase n=1 Tax=Conexibacter stalactiti TaxID=1940611 RepID=A0ABU4HY43_9ACTN|nr:HAMP domain-containing sensor histidine kinase [Conexibacter stalactiti]MDW5598247.1 HAMP domain-containing sensor histidine kinase [Conexibacter stalactiti]MEC5038889.1 HAMP domain-containing sensor histidine kinase [Conexibacter stalactiti]